MKKTNIGIVYQKGDELHTHAMLEARGVSTDMRELPTGAYHLLIRSFSGALVAAEDHLVLG